MLRTEKNSRGEWLDAAVESGGLTGILRLRDSVRFAHRIASLRMTDFKRTDLCRMTILFLICLSMVGAANARAVAQSSGPAKAFSPVEQSLVASEKSLIEAKKKDDGAFFKSRVADGFELVGIDGKLLEGQEALDNLGDSGLVELTPYDMKVVTAGDGAAIVTYDAIVREAPAEDQGSPPRYQHFSSVWVKAGDGWKLKFHQATAEHWGDW
jgi:hypothetical protein